MGEDLLQVTFLSTPYYRYYSIEPTLGSKKLLRRQKASFQKVTRHFKGTPLLVLIAL